MLVASAVLIDLIHEHPLIADGGPQTQFNVIFPRAKAHRVWVQFQRKGVVNTAHFDIPVKELGNKHWMTWLLDDLAIDSHARSN
jgi:hypothetical protein